MSLNLDERQRAMLLEMGVRVWLPPPAAPAPSAAASSVIDVAPEKIAKSPLATRPEGRFHADRLEGAERPGPRPAAGQPVSAPVGEAAAAPAADPDWSGLVQAVAACRACGLCEGRHAPLLAAQAPPPADWLVVGDMPDEEEERAGRAFVGPAGVLLDNMLRALGLRRTTAAVSAGAGAGPGGLAHVTLAARCRPALPRNPLPADLAACEPFLLRELAQVRPRVILALGRFAAQALLQHEQPALAAEPLGRLRGRPLTYRGLPLVVSYPPAYLVRNPADKARAWQDLCRARALLGADAPG